MGMQDHVADTTVNGKYVCCGSFFLSGRHDAYLDKLVDVRVPRPESVCLVHIAATMLSARGGDFDEDDTIFTDIYSIDRRRLDTTNGFGGVWDHHFGAKGDVKNQAISTFVGYVNSEIKFRIAITGDDWVGASFFVMEL